MPRPRRYSPAALRLAAIGCTQQRIADHLGVARAQVSQYLTGRRPPHPRLIPAIRLLAGNDAATDVARLLGIEETQ